MAVSDFAVSLEGRVDLGRKKFCTALRREDGRKDIVWTSRGKSLVIRIGSINAQSSS